MTLRMPDNEPNETSNQKEVKRILAMDTRELLGYVLDNPEYLTDSYFHVFGNAIRKRSTELPTLGKR